jgi:hypothetical protein
VSARGTALVLACIGIALLLGAVARSASGSAPSFRSKLLFDTSNSTDAAIGDLNGDGRPDIVSTDYNGQSVDVYLNRGHGTFTSGHEYEVAWLARSVAIADLNGDGKPDLVVVTDDPFDETTVVSVLFNEGGGRFRRGGDYDLGQDRDNLDLVRAGDVNGDGKPDLVTTNYAKRTLSVLLNRGDGSFQAQPDQYQTGGGPFDIALGDLNGDGKLDIVTAVDANTVSVLLNRGDGGFEAKRDYPTGRDSEAVAIRDLDGDGKPDILTANYTDDTVSVLPNAGDGSFRARRDYRTGSGPTALAIGDLNGDRKLDVAVMNEVGSVSLLLSKGGGGFQPKLDYAYPLSGLSIAIANLNGDGRPDLAVPVLNQRNGYTYLAVLLNTPGLCNVQRVGGMTLAAAKRQLAHINCRVGKVSRAYSKAMPGLVISQKPKFGAVRPGGGKVNLVVSKGRKH